MNQIVITCATTKLSLKVVADPGGANSWGCANILFCKILSRTAWKRKNYKWSIVTEGFYLLKWGKNSRNLVLYIFRFIFDVSTHYVSETLSVMQTLTKCTQKLVLKIYRIIVCYVDQYRTPPPPPSTQLELLIQMEDFGYDDQHRIGNFHGEVCVGDWWVETFWHFTPPPHPHPT